MKRLFLIGAIVAASSSYALELRNAEILEHHSWISGPDDKITIIAGHIENNPNVYVWAAEVDSPLSHPVSPNSVANSPAIATNPKRLATRNI